jgi:hypothetical protein
LARKPSKAPRHVPKHIRHPRRDARPVRLVKVLICELSAFFRTHHGTSLLSVTDTCERSAHNRLTGMALLFRSRHRFPCPVMVKLGFVNGAATKSKSARCRLVNHGVLSPAEQNCSAGARRSLVRDACGTGFWTSSDRLSPRRSSPSLKYRSGKTGILSGTSGEPHAF